MDFLRAVDEGDIEALRLVLTASNKIPPQCMTEGLERAVENDSKIVVDILLEHGAPVSESVLNLVVHNKSYEIAHLLMRSEGLNFLKSTQLVPHYPGHINYVVVFAATNRTFRDILLDELIFYNNIDINLPTPGFRFTPLHIACMMLLPYDVIKFLIDKGANINVQDSCGRTPLDHLISTRQKTCSPISKIPYVELFLQHNADVNNFDEYGMSTLHASYKDSTEGNVLCELLVKNGADVNAQITKHTGKTLLHIVARNTTCSNVLSVLLKHGAKVNAVDSRGFSPLHHSTFNRNVGQSVSSILLRNGAMVNAKTSGCSNSGIFKSVRLSEESGFTPLHLAALNGRLQICKLLLENGADVNSRTKESGLTVLHLIALMSRMITTAVLLLDISNLCLQYGANINIQNSIGKTPFHFAGAHDKLKVFFNNIVFKMQVANMYIHRENLELLDCDSLSDDFKRACKTEVTDMKLMKLPHLNLSFFEVLTIEVNALTNLALNKDVYQIFCSYPYKQRFPLYADLLSCNFKMGKKIGKRFEALEMLIGIIFGKGLIMPHVCSMRILDFMSDIDLENFVNF